MAKMDSDIVGWITRGGKRIPIRKGKGNAKTKSGWGEKNGADHYYQGGKSISRIEKNDDGTHSIKYKRDGKDTTVQGKWKDKEGAKRMVEGHAEMLKKEKREDAWRNKRGMRKAEPKIGMGPGKALNRGTKIKTSNEAQKAIKKMGYELMKKR